MDEKQDVYSRVTNKIIADLERGNLTWLQPWQAGHKAGDVSRPLRSTGERYQGVNVLMLWAAAMENGYVAPIWMTFNQAKQLLTSFEVIEIVGRDIAIQAARNFRTLREHGITVRKTVDTLIATRCIHDGLILLHSDKDFEPFVAHLGLRVAYQGA